MNDEHCQDCCCAKSWEALGITGYTGKSIPEEIASLTARLAEAEDELQKQIQFKLDAYTEITSLRNTVNMLEAARAAKGGRDD